MIYSGIIDVISMCCINKNNVNSLATTYRDHISIKRSACIYYHSELVMPWIATDKCTVHSVSSFTVTHSCQVWHNINMIHNNKEFTLLHHYIVQ